MADDTLIELNTERIWQWFKAQAEEMTDAT